MGREIRTVPTGWEHPKKTQSNWRTGASEEIFTSLYDKDFDFALSEWLKEFEEWKATGFVEACKKYPEYATIGIARAFAEYHGGPPDYESYRPLWSDESRTHFQMYETVSEGTPVTPVFATKPELVDYLVANGDYWDQKRGQGGWSREAAERFVGSGWAPSMMVTNTAAGVEIKTARDGI